MCYFTYWSYNQPRTFVIHGVLKLCFLFRRATNEMVSQQDTFYRKKLCVQRVSSFPFSHLFPFQILFEAFYTIVLPERDFVYVSFQILREKSVKIDQLALVRRLAAVFPRELGGCPGYEYIDQELQSERERFSSFLSLSIRKYPWKRATTRDPNGTLRLFANSPLGRNTADNRSGVTGWSYKI